MPLVDHTTVVRLIRQTHTQTGLSVSCALDTRRYPKAIKLSPEQKARIILYKHAVLPDWNYTLLPNEKRN
jgi:hypothetical protein